MDKPSYKSLKAVGCLQSAFILEGGNLGSVDENDAGIDHAVIECFVENMLENLAGQCFRKTSAVGIGHRGKAHIKASANKKKFQKQKVAEAAKVYAGKLRDEVNAIYISQRSGRSHTMGQS